MYYFESHLLIEEQDGFIVRLYLDRHLSEFASEFHYNKDQNGVKERLEYAAATYVQKKLPGKKVKTVVIMLGSLMIAAIPFAYAIASNPPEAQWLPKPPASSAGEAETPDKQVQAPDDGNLDEDTLTLVNKQNPLPEDYVPANLVVPDVRFASSGSEVKQMREDAASALEQMFASAEKDGVQLYAVSGYRSYARQVSVFASSVKSHGSEEAANQFSAKPGQSEHQTGLAMDVSAASVSYSLSRRFGVTKEGKWLKDNADKFGFIIRFPKDQEAVTGYQYEPWHVRYVGKEAAAAIVGHGVTLEEYLGK